MIRSTVPCREVVFISEINSIIFFLQIVKGSKADVINSCLPTVPGSNPRCWVFSNAGDKIVVGYVQGTLQVSQI